MTAKKKSITIKDVAKYAGVSPRTVSNVVNDWPYVSNETRKKVQEAIRTVGYRPNQMARSLITGQTKSIGVIIQDISNPFFGMAMRGCEDILYENGYSQFLCSASEEKERERYFLDLLLSKGVDAVILWGTRLCGKELQGLIGDTIPYVTVDFEEGPAGENHSIVNIDNIQGAECATRHLIKQGYRTIAHLASSLGRVTCRRRITGFKRALNASGSAFDSGLIYRCEPSISGGYRAALKLLKERKPDAIFCYNDLMAIGAIYAAKHCDRHVPNDVAVVGFDDIMAASTINPPLTTMRIAQYDVGKLTGNLVLERLKDGTCFPRSQVYPVELQVRESCGALKFAKENKHHLLENIISSFAIDVSSDLHGRSNIC